MNTNNNNQNGNNDNENEGGLVIGGTIVSAILCTFALPVVAAIATGAGVAAISTAGGDDSGSGGDSGSPCNWGL